MELKELDAWIAEHLMGWVWANGDPEQFTEHDLPWLFMLPAGLVMGEAYRVKTAPEGRPFTRQYRNFRPTTDPAAAMLVLERLCGVSHNILIYRSASDRRWCVAMDHTYKDKEIGPVVAETLPLAICQFAKALFSKGQP